MHTNFRPDVRIFIYSRRTHPFWQSFALRTCIHNRKCRMDEEFCCPARQKITGIIGRRQHFAPYRAVYCGQPERTAQLTNRRNDPQQITGFHFILAQLSGMVQQSLRQKEEDRHVPCPCDYGGASRMMLDNLPVEIYDALYQLGLTANLSGTFRLSAIYSAVWSEVLPSANMD